MLPGTYRATQKFYIFLIVYLTGRTPKNDISGGFLIRSKIRHRNLPGHPEDRQEPDPDLFFGDFQ